MPSRGFVENVSRKPSKLLAFSSMLTKMIIIIVHIDHRYARRLRTVANHMVKVLDNAHIGDDLHNPQSCRKDKNEFYLSLEIEEVWWLSLIVPEVVEIVFWYIVKILKINEDRWFLRYMRTKLSIPRKNCNCFYLKFIIIYEFF